MKKNEYKIDFEVYIVFIIVISISIFNAIYSTMHISRNEDSTKRILTVNVPSLQSLDEMNLLITKAKMYSTNWVYLQSYREDKDKLRVLQNVEYPELKAELSRLMKSWKKREDVDSLRKIFSDFEKLIVTQSQLMNTVVSIEDYKDPSKILLAESIIENKIQPQSAKIIQSLKRLILQKEANAERMHRDMADASNSLMWSIFSIALLMILVVLVAAFYLSNYIIVPTMKLRNFIVQMARGEIPEINLKKNNSAIGQMTEAVSTLSVSLKKTTQFAHNIGDGNLDSQYQPLSDHDELGNALMQMRDNLRIADEENRQRSWVSSRTEKINSVLRENTDDINKLSDAIIRTMVKYLNAFYGGLYLLEDGLGSGENTIALHGSYGMGSEAKIKKVIDYGDGLIGQAIKDGEVIYLQDAPANYAVIGSGLGSVPATHILIIPLKHHDKVYGAVELAGFTAFQTFEIGFIKNIGETIASTISSVIANTLTKRLLEETRKQASRLKTQEEELLRTNEELSHQSRLLQASEEELKQGNIDMKTKARELQHKNEILEQAREAISIKAKELELNNRYKSEFLANMSHELRTPLNSILILAKLLSENRDHNLTDKQSEYARVIHKSGNDLLMLINDILDLSKVEAGKIEMLPEVTEIELIKNDIKSLFIEVANDKNVDFEIESHSEIPSTIITDKIRLEQVIKNLLSNAFKFTPSKGKVTLKIKRPDKNITFSNFNLQTQKNVIEISVTDTGIGIPSEKQALIFEAFQQADGSTSRKYGGTGLGLSISKMLVSMLGGEMQIISEQGQGSTFFIFIPEVFDANHHNSQEELQPNLNSASVALRPVDDRDKILINDKLILIGESDFLFANVLLDMAHEKKYKAILATGYDEVISFTEMYKPSAIILDENIKGGSTKTIIEKMKANIETASIPLHIFSEYNRLPSAKEIGATAYLRKPLDKRDLDDAFVTLDKSIQKTIQNVLIIEDMILHQEIVKNLLATRYVGTGIHIAKNVEEAEEYLSGMNFDCIILDLDLGNGSEEGCSLLNRIKANDITSHVPVIVFTATDIDSMNNETLQSLSEAIVPKDGEAVDRLMQETDQFLNSIDLKDKNLIPPFSIVENDILHGKTVLLADDDMRNIYALTSLLENHKMTVIPASNGVDAINQLEKYPQIDLILMDIMMPEMDGYEAMKLVRSQERYCNLPILALTAKAMKGDKEKCIQCGATDYISKPVVMDVLFYMMRTYLLKIENTYND